MKCYIVDVETGGLNRELHSLLEIAIMSFEIKEDGNYHKRMALHLIIKPEPLVISEWAYATHTKNGLLKDCMEKGIPDQDAKIAYKDWCVPQMVAAGFNPKFDTEWLARWAGVDYWDYRAIDPRQAWLRVGDTRVPDARTAYQRAGLQAPKSRHRAASDCDQVAPLLARCLKGAD